MTTVIAFAGNKGGPGKTTEMIGVLHALARAGLNVAAVDMDSQGNLTRRLGVDKRALIERDAPGVAEMLDPKNPAHVEDVAVPCGWENDEAAKRITVLPSLDRESLAARAEEAFKPGAATRLRRSIFNDGWADAHDVVGIDTGPDVNHLLVNALTASDAVIIIVTPSLDAIEGGVYLTDFIHRERVALERPELDVMGVAVNAYDDEAADQRAHVDNLPASFAPWGGADLLIQPFVPHRFTLAKAQDRAVPITALRHTVAGELAGVYDQHAQFVIARLKGTRP